MRLFGFQITRTKSAVGAMDASSSLYDRGWWPWRTIQEPFAGAWQRNISWGVEDVLSYAPVRACATLIASDISKLRIKLTQETSPGVWEETAKTSASPFLRVLEEPNDWQIRIKFIEQWMLSKLIHGNAYILKRRESQRGMVNGLTVLDPNRCRPYVSTDGSVWYALGQDNLAELESANVVVPASEIIHDTMATLYHPLCGVSPISACGVAAIQGLRIQQNSAEFFANHAQPGGILVAPGQISPETRKRLEEQWNTNYSGANVGKIAVVGDGIKYEAMSVNAVDAQLIEQLKWTAHDVCTAFHVPPYMIGVGPAPTYNNIEALNAQYYAQCLQVLIETVEALLDKGLEVPSDYGTELDIDSLLRMDTSTRMSVAEKAMTAGMSPNEVRRKFHGLGPVKGGDQPYLQQQNFSLEALAKRDAQDDPFGTSAPTPAAPSDAPDDEARSIASWMFKSVALGLN